MVDGSRSSDPVSVYQVLDVRGRRQGKSCSPSGFLEPLPLAPSSILSFLFLSKALR